MQANFELDYEWIPVIDVNGADYRFPEKILAKAFNHYKRKCGIYKWLIDTGKPIRGRKDKVYSNFYFYIGQSNDLLKRFRGYTRFNKNRSIHETLKIAKSENYKVALFTLKVNSLKADGRSIKNPLMFKSTRLLLEAYFVVKEKTQGHYQLND